MQTNFDELSFSLDKIFEEKILKIIFSNCTKESKYKKNRNWKQTGIFFSYCPYPKAIFQQKT